MKEDLVIIKIIVNITMSPIKITFLHSHFTLVERNNTFEIMISILLG